MADLEGVPWVPWNSSFEGLPLKILCANVCSHTGTPLSKFSSAARDGDILYISIWRVPIFLCLMQITKFSGGGGGGGGGGMPPDLAGVLSTL